jgi:diadenylate cyclase
VRVPIDREPSRGGSHTGSNGGWAAALPGADQLRATLALMAPGTVLRDGLERILRGRTGALIVLGHDKVVEQMCTGGFPLDVEFSASCRVTARELSGRPCT